MENHKIILPGAYFQTTCKGLIRTTEMGPVLRTMWLISTTSGFSSLGRNMMEGIPAEKYFSLYFLLDPSLNHRGVSREFSCYGERWRCETAGDFVVVEYRKRSLVVSKGLGEGEMRL